MNAHFPMHIKSWKIVMFEEKKMDSKMLIIPSRKKNVGEAKIQQQSFQTYLWMNNSGNDLTEKIGKLSRIFPFCFELLFSGHQEGEKIQFFLKSRRAADRWEIWCFVLFSFSFVKGNRIVKIFRSFASDRRRQQHLG